MQKQREKKNILSSVLPINMISQILGSRTSICVAVFQGTDVFIKRAPSSPSSFPSCVTPYSVEYPFGHFKSAALLMSPLHHLPTLSVLDLGGRVDSSDAEPELLRIKQNFGAISVLS